jgi:hypothetical protein
MTALLVANNKTEETVGDPAGMDPGERDVVACLGQRVLWFARDSDVIVVPREPDEAFLEYVAALTGTRRSSLRLVVPPPGRFGSGILSRDRLLSQACLNGVREALAGRPVGEVTAMVGGGAVAALVRSLGAEAAMPGYRLAAAGGTTHVNRKSLFRAIAGGVDVPVPHGWSGDDQADAGAAIVAELAEGHCVIVKQDLQSGGKGNEVLCPRPGVRVIGTRSPAVVLPDAAAVGGYLTRRWDWLTNGGRNTIVIERYFPDAVPFFAEYLISDHGPSVSGHGEMLMTPTYAGVIAPTPGLAPGTEAGFIETGLRLCAPFYAMGYRGTMSLDAIMTPGGQFLFTEINCRMGGSSHLHRAIGDYVLGPEYRPQRIIAERSGWCAPSFREAAERLEAGGLGYDQESRLGVILTCDQVPADGTVGCCVIAEDLDSVRKYERLLSNHFSRVRG